MNSVISHRGTLRMFLDVVGTVSLLRFVSLLTVFWYAR